MQAITLTSNSHYLFNFFTWKIKIINYKNCDFCKLLRLPVQFSKFKNFLWVCWFLDKNLSNFIYPVWKLHNPYCHTYVSVSFWINTILIEINLFLDNLWSFFTQTFHEKTPSTCFTKGNSWVSSNTHGEFVWDFSKSNFQTFPRDGRESTIWCCPKRPLSPFSESSNTHTHTLWTATFVSMLRFCTSNRQRKWCKYR